MGHRTLRTVILCSAVVACVAVGTPPAGSTGVISTTISLRSAAIAYSWQGDVGRKTRRVEQDGQGQA